MIFSWFQPTFGGMSTTWIMIILVGIVVALHTFADFFLQTDEIATNKSTSNKVLTQHIVYYSIPFLVVFGPVYTIVNAVLHWVTDWCSSRIAKHFFLKGDRHNFFCTIGVDQFIHIMCLIVTLPLVL